MQVATLISATVSWDTAGIQKIGWGWTGVIWLYNIVTYMLLDPLKFAVQYALSGRAWGLVVDKRVRTFYYFLLSLHAKSPCLLNISDISLYKM